MGTVVVPGVGVAVAPDVLVGVGVGVAVGTDVEVGVGDGVGVRVRVAVGVGVLGLSGMLKPGNRPSESTAKTALEPVREAVLLETQS